MKTTMPKAETVDRMIAGRDRAARNRSAWPVAMHTEKGELKVDRRPEGPLDD